ncbi:hypothetical protein ACHJH3_06335 [Campylobacter sp. MOP7]|uniref:hypothetical protein n=1 Tax=Campylobacter canis TaxID=3378588 RepID=UPI00387E5C8E
MALKKIEISDSLLDKLGAFKSPKELGEAIEQYVNMGLDCSRFSKENITLYNIILDLANRVDKSDEINTIIKNSLKEINAKLMEEF